MSLLLMTNTLSGVEQKLALVPPSKLDELPVYRIAFPAPDDVRYWANGRRTWCWTPWKTTAATNEDSSSMAWCLFLWQCPSFPTGISAPTSHQQPRKGRPRLKSSKLHVYSPAILPWVIVLHEEFICRVIQYLKCSGCDDSCWLSSIGLGFCT